ncbi:hypothetical protein SESBI_41847 [Sesbania bispinosa]|nr:hypothetical protein SESBI_41847 [Sesbania bispinosa]
MGYHIPVIEVHTHWMRLTFNDGGIDEPGSGLSILLECDEVLRRFKELHLSGKVLLKSKMREVAFPETTSMCPPPNKVKTKGGVKGKCKSKYSTKREPSLFEHVDAMHSQQESSSIHPTAFQARPRCKKKVTMLDQIPLALHPFIVRDKIIEHLFEDQECVATLGVPSKVLAYLGCAIENVYGTEHLGLVCDLGVGVCPSNVFGLQKHHIDNIKFGSSGKKPY